MVSAAIDATISAEKTVARQIGTRLATAVLLIEGFVSVSIQMIVIRQLVPVVGHSINVTSIVITTFLAALAFGYRSGGRLRGDARRKLRRNLITVAFLSAIGLSFRLIELVFGIYFALFSNVLVGVALYSLLFLAPIVFLLAQTVVLLIECRQGEGAAEQAGDTFHLSTIGNVIGGLVTTLIVMYYLGIAAAVFINVSLLILAYLFVVVNTSATNAMIAAGVMLVALMFNVVAERESFLTTTAHGNYAIVEASNGDGRYLIVNGQNASHSDKAGMGHPYIEWFEDQLFESPSMPSELLVLGAGGFTLGQGREYSGVTTFVDVDEQLADIADEFLSPRRRDGVFVADDARSFLLRTNSRYDAIVVDTYSHRSSMPPHLMTIEFFTLVRHKLKPNGTAYMNIISSDDETFFFGRGIDNTIRSVFANCVVHRIDTPDVVLYNKLYRCQPSALDEYRAIYTDRNTRSATDASP